jgi:hypothetical protein
MWRNHGASRQLLLLPVEVAAVIICIQLFNGENAKWNRRKLGQRKARIVALSSLQQVSSPSSFRQQ